MDALSGSGPLALSTNAVTALIHLHRQPALVVLGGGSPALHPRFEETYRLLLDWLPNARGFFLPGVTHFLQMESPQASAALATAHGEFFAACG